MATADAYSALAERHGYPNSARYLRILEFLMTPQQARIAADLPSSAEEVAARQDLPLETVKAEINALFRNGVVIPKNFQTQEFPRFARGVGQLHDTSQSILDLDLYDDETKKELFRLWEEFCQEEWDPDRMADIEKHSRVFTRVVPSYRAIEDLPDIQPYEDMREIVKAQQVCAVVSCSCRARRSGVGKVCEHSHDVNCLQFNRSAEYGISRGHGRQLTYEQAMELVDQIEEDGLVHNMRNDRTMVTNTLCSCCIDCCLIWLPMDEHGIDISKAWAKSRFQAEVDQEPCNGCQVCIERCMFDAIEMEKVPGSRKLKAVVDPDKCFGCGVCVLKCAPGALSVKTVRPIEHIPEVLIPGGQGG
jgi:Pyruvate/2-oxoacid:ferredoxin oxidoreductase delta subunit